MKTINFKGKKYKLFTKDQHIKKHTLKENTHCFDCLYCEFSEYEADKIIKQGDLK